MHKKTNVRKRLGKASVLILLIAVISTMGCGKAKEATVVTEAETIGNTEQAAEVTPEVTEAVSEQESSEPESSEAEPETKVEQESSEEESSEEITVDMSKVKAFDAPKTMYASKKINIRKGPSVSFESVGMLNAGDPVEVIGQDAAGWYEFKYKNEVAFASNDYLSEEAPVAADATQPDAAAVLPTPAAQPIVADAAPAVSPVVVTAPAGVLIIGDSRCVQMRDVSGGGGCSWICEKAKGYTWFESNALPRADESIGKGTKVVIALGVNDVGNVNNYASLINYKAAEWAARGAKTYFVSVNPVWENPYVTEEQVQNFNATLQPQLIGVKWIDTHTYLMNNGYSMVDGMHFDDATNLKVFQLIVGSLR